MAVTALVLAGATETAAQRAISAETMLSERRVALVIAGYPVGRLNNLVLDARAVAQALRVLGFDVLAYENLDYRKMQRAVADYGERISGGGGALF